MQSRKEINEMDDRLPLVTIAIPTYNNEKYIADAVKSAMAQDYANLEILIVDDASKDNTEKTVEPFCTDPRVFYFRNEQNIGRVANYRKALYQLAKGQWYLNLDGDDYLTDPAFISKSMQWIKTYDDVVMVAGACQRMVNEKQDYIIHSKHSEELLCIDGKKYFLGLPAQEMYFSHLTTIYNRKRAMDIDFYGEDILSADFESIYRLILTGNIVSYNKIVGVWRIHDTNVSSNSFFLIAEIIKNFRFVDNSALFAAGYLEKKEISSWKKIYTVQIIESYILKVLVVKPRNSIAILFNLCKEYPLYFAQACFRILSRNFKKLVKAV